MVGWLLNGAYLLLIALASPWLLYRAVTTGRYRRGWGEKLLGAAPRAQDVVWFHAVSVGEVLQLRGIVSELKARCPQLPIAISTTTDTGLEVARRHFPDEPVFYAPLDFTWAVRRAVRRLQPRLLVLVELELWPNLIREAAAAGVPICVANGRLSQRSFRGYRRLRWLFRPLLRQVSWFGVQTPEYARRFRELGAPDERIAVTGSVKFDHVQTDRHNPRTRALRSTFGLSEDAIIWVAGSTHAPEEEIVLSVYRRLKARHPALRLILAPRHPERCDQVCRMIEAARLPVVRRTALSETSADGRPHPANTAIEDDAVIVLDTVGELGACWGLAAVAFIGGSLAPRRGGQNMLEPAAFGAAVCFGPNTWNFADVVELLLAHDAARVVADAEQLHATIERWLAEPRTREAIGRRAARCVRSQTGAVRRTVEALLQVAGATSSRAAQSRCAAPLLPSAAPSPSGDASTVDSNCRAAS